VREIVEAKIGVIGGSGLYQIEGLTDVEEFYPDTPWGKPSDAIMVGTLEGQQVAFLPRHGRGHRFNPTDIPVRANIYALKLLGVDWVISVSAVGSLREEIAPLDLVVPDQIFDRTALRPRTFFGDGEGIVVHAGFADPFCETLRKMIYEAAQNTGARAVHWGGTYVCMEGPLFSTRAESNTYRKLDFDIIGMTAIPEAKLAREAEMCYAILACSTDYDVWHESHESVTVEMVINNLQQNVGRAKEIIKMVVPQIGQLTAEDKGECDNALASAIITDRSRITPAMIEKYGVLLSKYFK
jgi:5'-methylthioadenosine phosphorylase